MLRYIGKRQLSLLPVLLVVSLFIFLLIHLVPGDPAAAMLGEQATQAQIDAVDLTKHVNRDTVPAFIWHSVDDPVVDATDSTRFILALQSEGIDCEYHLYDRGGHGLGLANKVYARAESEIMPDIAMWTTLADVWMSRRA